MKYIGVRIALAIVPAMFLGAAILLFRDNHPLAAGFCVIGALLTAKN